MAPAFSHLSEDDIKRLETENGFRQSELAIDMIEYYLDRERPFRLQPSHIQQLQSSAVEGIEQRPGEWRMGPIGIEKSEHSPPPAHMVPMHVAEMCDYVNAEFHEKSAFHLAAYIMWRLNWIHPFEDGNGRTSRTLSYVVLCIKTGYRIPGSPTVPDQIQRNRDPYFKALEAADAALKERQVIDVTDMEELLKRLLAFQLVSVLDKAAEASAGT
jgi:Fic family protein